MNVVPDKAILGQAIRQARESINMSKERLGESVNKSSKTIANYEGGKSLPTITTLAAIADALGYTPNDLVTGDLSRGSLHNADKDIVDLLADTTPEEQRLILEFAEKTLKSLRANKEPKICKEEENG